MMSLTNFRARSRAVVPAAVIVEIHIDNDWLNFRLSVFLYLVEKRNRNHRPIQNFRRKWFFCRVALWHWRSRGSRLACLLRIGEVSSGRFDLRMAIKVLRSSAGAIVCRQDLVKVRIQVYNEHHLVSV